MGLLAGVGADVHSQGASLDEGLAAATVVARVRSFVGVYPVMPLEVGLAVEALILQRQTRHE